MEQRKLEAALHPAVDVGIAGKSLSELVLKSSKIQPAGHNSV